MLVADTNTIAYTVVGSPYSDAASEILRQDSDWATPLVWRSELANVLSLYVRRNALSLSEALQAQSLAQAIIDDREYEVPSAEVLALACESGASAYDCEFVVLARQMDCPVITMDRKLARTFPGDVKLLVE